MHRKLVDVQKEIRLKGYVCNILTLQFFIRSCLVQVKKSKSQEPATQPLGLNIEIWRLDASGISVFFPGFVVRFYFFLPLYPRCLCRNFWEIRFGL